MAEWIHCNKCYLIFTSAKTDTKYYLTNCGHIFCDICLDYGKQNICFICKIECRNILLNSNIEPEVQAYFSKPDDLLHKYTKVVEFQMKHRLKLLEYVVNQHKQLNKKYLHAKEFIKKINKDNNELRKDNQILRSYFKMFTNSPVPGNASTGGTPPVPFITPDMKSSASFNPNRFIIRGHQGSAQNSAQKKFNWAPNGTNNNIPSSAQASEVFCTPASYISSTSVGSVASSRSRTVGSTGYATPSVLNMSAMSLASRSSLRK